jgi:hypothetical protein
MKKSVWVVFVASKRNLIKAKRVGGWLKVALYLLKNEDDLFESKWDGLRTYRVNNSRPFTKKEFVNVIEINRTLLKRLLS